MGGKPLLSLILAGGSGLLAMYGVNQLLGGRARPPALRNVVVAARDIRQDETLTPELLRVMPMTREAAPTGSFSDPAEIDGRWLAFPLLAGEPILAGKLGEKGTPPGLRGLIPKGMRAFAIEVNEQTGVSGFVLPDHTVDVVQEPRDAGNGRRTRGRTILQNVRVLAVGQIFNRPEDKSITVRTVTLAVTPDQVEQLVAAQQRGKLALALRGVGDEAVAELVPDDPEPEESRAPPPPVPVSAPAPVLAAAPPAPPPPRVIIHHGSRTAEAVGWPGAHPPPRRLLTARRAP